MLPGIHSGIFPAAFAFLGRLINGEDDGYYRPDSELEHPLV